MDQGTANILVAAIAASASMIGTGTVACVAIVQNNKRLDDVIKRLDSIESRLANIEGHIISFATKIARPEVKAGINE